MCLYLSELRLYLFCFFLSFFLTACLFFLLLFFAVNYVPHISRLFTFVCFFSLFSFPQRALCYIIYPPSSSSSSLLLADCLCLFFAFALLL